MQANLLRLVEAKLPGGGSEQPSHMERTFSNLLSYLQDIWCAGVACCFGAVSHADGAFVDEAIFESFLLL